MANTSNYSLALLETDDTVSEANYQKTLETLDRALGEFLQLVAVGGVISGWTINTGKTVGAGEGIVNGCHCKTTTTTDISSSLSNNATNYVYATTNATSPDDGAVTFGAETNSANVPASAVQLGTITLNAGGTVTATDDNPLAFMRDYMKPLRYRIIPEQTYYYDIEPAASLEVEYDHSSDIEFAVPMNVRVVSDPRVRCTVLADGLTGGVFRLLIENTWTEAYGELYGDYGYGYSDEDTVRVVWQRDGFV